MFFFEDGWDSLSQFLRRGKCQRLHWKFWKTMKHIKASRKTFFNVGMWWYRFKCSLFHSRLIPGHEGNMTIWHPGSPHPKGQKRIYWFMYIWKKSNGVVVAVHSLLLLWSHQANSDNDSVAINVVIFTILKLMQRHTLSSHQIIFLRKIKWNLVLSSLTSHQSERSLNVPCLFHDSYKIILFQVDLQHGLGNRPFLRHIRWRHQRTTPCQPILQPRIQNMKFILFRWHTSDTKPKIPCSWELKTKVSLLLS